MKMVKFDTCRECPHFESDPATISSKFWGEDVCTERWDGKGNFSASLKILDDPDTIPLDCRLEDAPKPKGECDQCRYLTEIPSHMDPCYSCCDYDKFERKS